MKKPIKVLLVEDSLVVLTLLKRLLKDVSDIEVVGTARDGNDALTQISQVQPQVICTDLQQGEMNGLAFIRQVMMEFPTPILVISNLVQPENSQQIFESLQAGAVDVFPKHHIGTPPHYSKVQQDLIQKIRVLAGVRVFSRHQRDSKLRSLPTTAAPLTPAPGHSAPPNPTRTEIRAIAIGSSTGGPQALCQVLKGLEANLSVPVFCTQHISPGFLTGLTSWLNSQCQLTVKIAEAGELPLAGHVYLAPEGHHLGINTQGHLIHLPPPPVDGHCPSVTVMFESLAAFYGRYLAGVLLTGMGRDGATGLQTICQSRGFTIAQDEQTSVVFGMPKIAIDLGAAQMVLPLDQIAPVLRPQLRHRLTQS